MKKNEKNVKTVVFTVFQNFQTGSMKGHTNPNASVDVTIHPQDFSMKTAIKEIGEHCDGQVYTIKKVERVAA